jgi:hypothetical protein
MKYDNAFFPKKYTLKTVVNPIYHADNKACAAHFQLLFAYKTNNLICMERQ